MSKCQKNMKVMNLLEEPIYINDLKFRKMSAKDVENINTNNKNSLKGQQVCYILSGVKLLLMEMITDEKLMREGLKVKENLGRIVKLVKKKFTSVDLEYCKITNEITQERMLPLIKEERVLS